MSAYAADKCHASTGLTSIRLALANYRRAGDVRASHV